VISSGARCRNTLLHPPHSSSFKGSHDTRVGSNALRDLREQIVKENDPEKLRELVVAINVLLNMIEEQVAKIAGQRPPPRH